MRTVFAFLMASLDGYHETADGDLSWHNVDSEFNEFAVEQLDEADTLLFGRRTYLQLAEFWQSPAALQVDPATTERMNSYHKVVVSRRPGDGYRHWARPLPYRDIDKETSRPNALR
jgi:dihydrofolate reductase